MNRPSVPRIDRIRGVVASIGSLASNRMRRVRSACALAAATLLIVSAGRAQSNTRLLLAGGSGVPGHPGFVYRSFSNLAMNASGEIAFLSTLSSPRSELRAVVRSTGVSFSVVAFEGLRSPVPKSSYESFSAPSLSDGGVMAFTATLKNEHPLSAVVRLEGPTARAVAVSGTSVPERPEATFLEFSAPLINSQGNVVFAARTGGASPSTGLFLWTPQGTRAVGLPPEVNLKPDDLLKPTFFGHDAAVFVSRQASSETAIEQFFRAVAGRSFEQLQPPPAMSETIELLAPRKASPPVKMLLVLVEGENVQTEVLQGDPARAVMAKRLAGTALKPLGRIQGQTSGARENVIFAAAPVDQETDLALYCLCDGQVMRLTTPEEFLPIRQAPGVKSVGSLVSDSQHTTAFIAGGEGSDWNAIYVTSVP